ncbi:hypothetical protein [Halorientalis regularis]|jgi:hypothetical protein|uniref:Solute:sodium symporter small subunit n=1 Tax=Halorientalis regularis TaxID=660518 RepID=A0A1G7R8D9_9EURY|nr:hypothetical protein [Halorientalis regularis]SDG06944.1 hypothetical protein SAMN05216218_11497 [Halorientalis regularis]
MVEDPQQTEATGLRTALPQWGWAVVIGLASMAALSLLIPDELATNNGIPFPVFFWSVVAVQGIAAFGIIGVVLYVMVDFE